jgi:hypothetical protein
MEGGAHLVLNGRHTAALRRLQLRGHLPQPSARRGGGPPASAQLRLGALPLQPLKQSLTPGGRGVVRGQHACNGICLGAARDGQRHPWVCCPIRAHHREPTAILNVAFTTTFPAATE